MNITNPLASIVDMQRLSLDFSMFKKIAPFLLMLGYQVICLFWPQIQGAAVSFLKRRFEKDQTPLILSYLGKSFHDPLRLLQGMANAPFLLSGGRALEFFAPGSCDGQSVWEFYTYHSPYCVGRAIKTLAACGVDWDDAFQPLRDMASAQSGAIFHMHIDHIKAFIERAEVVQNAGVEVDARVASIISVLRDLQITHNQRVSLPGGVSLLIYQDKVLAELEGKLSSYVITGRITGHASNEPVSLIFKPGYTPMQHVLSFLTSSMQCCVTAFGAAHLYHAMTRQRKLIFWRWNTPNIPDVDGIDGDYAERTWVRQEPTSAIISDKRLSTAQGSKFIPFRFATNLPELLNHVRVEALKNLKWETSEGESRFTASEPLSLRMVFEANRQIRLGGEGQAALMAARELSFHHTVAFRATEEYEFPDELSGL